MNVITQVRTLFEQLVAELPPGTATVAWLPVANGDGTIIAVKPTNAMSADFGIHLDQSDVFDFSFGLGSTWELPFERRYRKGEKDILTEIEEMSRAVIAGKCEECRGPFWLTGRIYVDNYTYKVTNLPMFPIPLFGTRRYAPYAPSEF